jgi:hypothetical protein
MKQRYKLIFIEEGKETTKGFIFLQDALNNAKYTSSKKQTTVNIIDQELPCGFFGQFVYNFALSKPIFTKII